MDRQPSSWNSNSGCLEGRIHGRDATLGAGPFQDAQQAEAVVKVSGVQDVLVTFSTLIRAGGISGLEVTHSCIVGYQHNCENIRVCSLNMNITGLAEH